MIAGMTKMINNIPKVIASIYKIKPGIFIINNKALY